MATRTDPHSPSAIRPEDYRCVLVFGLARLVDGWPTPSYNVDRIVELRAQLGRKFSPIHSATNQCDICGASFLDGEVWKHEPTGEHITIGTTCADKYNFLSNEDVQRERRERNLFVQHGIATGKYRAERRASKIAARNFVRENPALRADLIDGKGHHIVADITAKLIKWGSISPRQIDLVHKLANEEREKKANPELPPAPIPADIVDVRTTITGRVLGTKLVDHDFGTSLKILVEVPVNGGAFKLWGTCPSSLDGPVRGKTIRFAARVQASRDDKHFGFFSRPTKASFVEEVA